MMKSKRQVWSAGLAVMSCVAAPGMALAAEVVAVAQAPESQWRVEAGAAFAAADAFGGWGVSLRAGREQARYLVVGFGIESTRLHAEGTVPIFGGQFSQTFQSTLSAAFVRAQLPTRFVMPYAELALGFVAVHAREGFNYQCNPQSGGSGAIAVGADVRIIRALSVGLRGGLRMPGTATLCYEAGGPYSFETSVMKSLATTVAYHW